MYGAAHIPFLQHYQDRETLSRRHLQLCEESVCALQAGHKGLKDGYMKGWYRDIAAFIEIIQGYVIRTYRGHGCLRAGISQSAELVSS